MPRTNPITDRELGIAQRLRDVREQNHLTKVGMAQALEINVLRYNNYEYGKVPLPYSVASKLCVEFEVSIRWLATNEGCCEPAEPIPEIENVAPKSSLTLVYDEMLKPAIEKYHQARQKWEDVGSIEKLPAADRVIVERKDEAIKNSLVGKINAAYQRGNYAERRNLIDTLSFTLRNYSKAYPQVIKFHDLWGMDWNFDGPVSAMEHFLFDLNSEIGIQSPRVIPNSVAELLARVRAFYPKPFTGVALAKVAGVAPSRVSDWFAGETSPGGDATLKLLKWVEEQEGKQNKSPSSAVTPLEPKQTRKASREKKPSGPPRPK